MSKDNSCKDCMYYAETCKDCRYYVEGEWYEPDKVLWCAKLGVYRNSYKSCLHYRLRDWDECSTGGKNGGNNMADYQGDLAGNE